MYLKSVNYFRAIAIMFIVLGHSYNLGASSQYFYQEVLKSLITGGTALFVFISGFMFHHVFFNKFEYYGFMKGKVNNVLFPYLILSSLAIFSLWALNKGAFGQNFDVTFFGAGDIAAVTVMKYYLTGNHMGPYWYIPFVMLVFLCSPAYIKFIKSSVKERILVLIVSFVISLFCHRPEHNINPVHSLFYFNFFYLFGILYSQYKEKLFSCFKGKELPLLVGVIFFAAIAVDRGETGNYAKGFFVYGGVDLMLMQKTLLILFFMSFLRRFEHSDLKVLDIIASTSFAVFFFHPWFISLFVSFSKKIDYPMESWLVYFIASFCVLLCSIGSAIIVKSLFKGSRSTRMLIGY
ncbi:acyltransferase [Ferrimonas pelagia]|uniref:acyltransferase family protein n=1 Tax=Ferrimonas pelagia TaxID=1177826 RepID=UPI0031E8AE93